jgi:hypothetical protein
MVDQHLLEYAEYDIEIVNWIDGSKRSDINKMILRPIEAGNIIEFSNGKRSNLQPLLKPLEILIHWLKQNKDS